MEILYHCNSRNISNSNPLLLWDKFILDDKTRWKLLLLLMGNMRMPIV